MTLRITNDKILISQYYVLLQNQPAKVKVYCTERKSIPIQQDTSLLVFGSCIIVQ